MKIDHDLHIHSYLSSCCFEKELQTPENIVSLAEEMGIKTIGFSDHVWANPDIPPSNWYIGQDMNQISRLREDLKEISTDINVLVGCEADMVAPGKFGITKRLAEQVDYVLLSCNHFQMKDFVNQPPGETPREYAKHMLDFFHSGVTSGLGTIISHPFMTLGSLDIFDEVAESISDQEFLDAFGLAAENQVGIEITTCYLPSKRNTPFSIETPIRILSLAKRAQCKFTFGSDAHWPEAQKWLPDLIELTEPVGIIQDDIRRVPVAKS